MYFKCTRSAGGVLPLYEPYRYVPSQRVGFLRRFGRKMGVDFKQFGLKSGMNTPNE